MTKVSCGKARISSSLLISAFTPFCRGAGNIEENAEEIIEEKIEEIIEEKAEEVAPIQSFSDKEVDENTDDKKLNWK